MYRVLVALTLAGSFILAGCNTMEGLGKDLQKVGSKIEKKADEKK
jgi:predicted small secreted protein